MMNKFIFVLVLCFFTQILNAQQRSKYLTKQQALANIDWYLHKIEEIHPSLYRYTSKFVVNSVLDSIRTRCLKPPQDSVLIDFFLTKLTRCDTGCIENRFRRLLPENR